MNVKGIALVILALVAIVALVGMIMLFNGELTGQAASQSTWNAKCLQNCDQLASYQSAEWAACSQRCLPSA
jgi:preprotein translocase subunit SecG